MAQALCLNVSDVDCEGIPYIIDVIKPFLLRHVKSSDLLSYMSFIVKDEASRISKLDSEGKHVEATVCLLECLEQAKEVPGRYAAFRDALGQAGYEHVVSVLQGGQVDENHLEHCELLKIFADPIIKKIDPILIIRHLRPHELLTSRDENEIRNCQNQHSREDAVFMLLNRVHQQKRGWYQHLMSTMYELYPQIVELVDPHFKEKKDLQLSTNQSEDMDTDVIMENTVTATGPAYDSEQLMAVHDSKAEKRDHNSFTKEEAGPSKRQKTDLQSSPAKESGSIGGEDNYQSASVESVSACFSNSMSSLGHYLNIPLDSKDKEREQNVFPGSESQASVSTRTSRETYDLTKEQQEELYKQIKCTFVDAVNPDQLSMYLNLGPHDDERIFEKSKADGRHLTASHLLLVMFEKVPNWIDNICQGLRHSNIALGHVADDIEAKRDKIYHDGKKNSKQSGGSPPTLETSETFDPVSVQEDSVSAGSNIAAIPARRCESDSDNDVPPADTDSHQSNNTQNNLSGSNNTHPTEGSSTMEEGTDEPEKELTLRPYQEELAQDGLNGINTVICAPTGSGKTLVAVKVMQEHLKQNGVRKIVFFANQVALVEQQFQVIQKHMPKDCLISKVSGDNPETMKMPLSELTAKNDILVMTPQILEDALEDGQVSSLSQFTMLVFDECHHTKANHVFNQIMFRYMAIKLDDSIPDDRKSLPQIVGLTASVGVGKAKDTKGTVEHIKNLCANLDAGGGVATVKKHKPDLAKYTGTTETEFQKTEGRKEDIFKSIVSEKLMKNIEEFMRKSNYVATVKEVKNFAGILEPPSDKVEQQYMSWLSNLNREVAKIDERGARRFFIAHRSHLEIYHRSLSINADCQTKDALKWLDDELTKLHHSTEVMDDTDHKLMNLYKKFKPQLKAASENPLCINPKLTALRATILQPFREELDGRVMVFVKTRDLAGALLNWMKDDAQLAGLNPTIFVGQGASSNKGGMTRQEQLRSADLFKKGDHKIIIATSVAEEGMDFSKCNLVIQYEYVTNEIAMMQARGRARAENSSFILVTDKQKRVVEKEELNIVREMMMYRALTQHQEQVTADPHQFQKDILGIQQIAKAERDNEAARGGNRVLRDGDFQLRCVKCDALACFSTDIRTVEKNHHAVLPEDFQSKINVRPHPKASVNLKDFKIASKITCKECGHDWGVAIIYKNATFPVIQIKSFVVIDSYDRRDLPKKWNKAPFLVSEITPDDFRVYKSLELES